RAWRATAEGNTVPRWILARAVAADGWGRYGAVDFGAAQRRRTERRSADSIVAEHSATSALAVHVCGGAADDGLQHRRAAPASSAATPQRALARGIAKERGAPPWHVELSNRRWRQFQFAICHPRIVRSAPGRRAGQPADVSHGAGLLADIAK